MHFGLYLSPGRHGLSLGIGFSLYLWITIRKYQSVKHLKSLRILIPLLLQQTFLLVIGFLIAINFTTTGGSETTFKLVSQKAICYLYMAFILFLVLKLFLDIFVMIYD